ncbi:hypothetical protein MK805_13880 [Shimazuella sp. AN120528]|uniref:hypothetical protein n=1 Tax=Shimazuella soli TaxID=1892854 RepID=UPI001F0D271C|nr:hypothetical protein [Shimazuella soli]MCH5586028.1 hypothetical protein [Shimazuella soli]
MYGQRLEEKLQIFLMEDELTVKEAAELLLLQHWLMVGFTLAELVRVSDGK